MIAVRTPPIQTFQKAVRAALRGRAGIIKSVPDPILCADTHQGKPKQACEDWLQQLVRVKTTEVRYHSASGLYLASLLWWASLRLDAPELTETALSDLRLLREWEEQAEEWGLVLAASILGEIALEEFLLKAAGRLDSDAQPLGFRQAHRTAQCFFYLAACFPYQSVGWRADLQSAVRYGTPRAVTEPEYHLARYELSSGGLTGLPSAV